MSTFQLSEGQAAAYEMVGRFLAQDEHRVAIITGYAGTGKTTMIKVLAKAYGTPVVLTPTGKAALRVIEATGIAASTIHRFLYDPREDDETGKVIFDLKSQFSEDMETMRGKLVLVDEASMVGGDVWDDLCLVAKLAEFRILLMGDLFQLPPVYKDKLGRPFSTLNYSTPFCVNLTEVIRQALDSPIIRASMILRSGRPEFEAMELLHPVGSSKLVEAVIDGRKRGGASICFTNARRHDINNRVRAALGYAPGTLQDGEPLLVTQNNYPLARYNGEIVDFGYWKRAPSSSATKVITDRFAKTSLEMQFGLGYIGDDAALLSPEEIIGKAETAKVGLTFIKRGARDWFRKFMAPRGSGDEEASPPPYLHSNYGYALTCHKSQGSEWPEVLVVLDPSLGRLHGTEKKRWLYTAITRAKMTTNYVYEQ